MDHPKECCDCGGTTGLIPIIEEEQDNGDVICRSCLESSDEYATCKFCQWDGKDVAYPVTEMSKNGECTEHDGESIMEPEDEEGWRHNVQR